MSNNTSTFAVGNCSQCGHEALKPDGGLSKQIYCSWVCLMSGERPHIYFDIASGEWKTCPAISVTALEHVQLFCRFHIANGAMFGGYGKDYNALVKRYMDARFFVINKNAQKHPIEGFTNELLLSH